MCYNQLLYRHLVECLSQAEEPGFLFVVIGSQYFRVLWNFVGFERTADFVLRIQRTLRNTKYAVLVGNPLKS